jgi:hypothetical protein
MKKLYLILLIFVLVGCSKLEDEYIETIYFEESNVVNYDSLLSTHRYLKVLSNDEIVTISFRDIISFEVGEENKIDIICMYIKDVKYGLDSVILQVGIASQKEDYTSCNSKKQIRQYKVFFKDKSEWLKF